MMASQSVLLFKSTAWTAPTPAQAEAGNYKKPRVKWRGLEIAVENPAGSVREGKGWRTKMKYDYGYVCRSEAVDGDEVEVYLGPEFDTAPTVYVVHQRKYGDWAKYDEDKCMLGFPSEDAARAAYLEHYDDPRFLGPITAMPVDEFVKKVRATYEKPAMIKSILFFKSARLSTSMREKIGTVGSKHREDMPADAFLLGEERKYPVKVREDGGWKYSPKLLLAAARRARMEGRDDLAKEADRIRARETGEKPLAKAHGKPPKPGRVVKEDGHDKILEDLDGLIDEHEHLVAFLHSVPGKEAKKEAIEEGGELKEFKKKRKAAA